MGADEEDPEDSDDGESTSPSIADLAAELSGAGGGAPSGPDDGGDADDEAAPTFADLTLALRGQRGHGAAESAGRGDRGADASPTVSPESASSAEQVDWAWRQAGADAPADEFNLSAETDAVLALIEDASNVLLLGELVCPEEYDVCTKLLGAQTPANLLLVTLTQSPEERLNVCRGFLGELPGETAIVSVGDSGASSPIPVDGGDHVTVETIPDPTDLMRIGITISRRLSELEDPDAPTAVCFHSLTALLQLGGNQQSVFRFLHTLRGRVRAAGARAHYHLDDGAHDQELVSLLRPLFDVTLRVGDDGSVSLKSGT